MGPRLALDAVAAEIPPAREQALLARERARWQVLGNQVMVGSFDQNAGAPLRLDMDQWGGYPAAQARLLRTIAERAAGRTVVRDEA